MQPDVAAFRPLGSTARPLCTEHDLLLLDLDGVVYAGPHALPGTAGRLARCVAAGIRLGFVTNNASRPPSAVAQHLRDLGIDADDDAVVPAAQAAARLVAEAVPPGSPVLVVGGEGLVHALAEHNLKVVWSANDDPAAVVQGFHPTVGWRLLAEGAYALAIGIPWVASNLDRTVPTDRGQAPGNGTLVDALRAASGREPQVAGKPEPALLDEARRRLGGTSPLVVGDRIDTDITGASRAGLPSLLVLTGVSSFGDLCLAARPDRPTYVAPDLGGLLLAHHELEPGPDGVRCGDWLATVREGVLGLKGPKASADGHAGTLAALRAAVAACWRHLDDPTQHADTVDVGPAERRLRDMMT